MTEGQLIKAPSKALQSIIGKANAEHKLAMNGAKATMAAKNYALKHALACGKQLLKAKEKAPHGTWEGLFEGGKTQSEGTENCVFDVSIRAAQYYMKLARFPNRAREVIASDDSDRFNLDRTYAALSGETEETEKEAQENHRAKGTGQNEWYTPGEYIQAARIVLGQIDLDPASSEYANQTVQAAKIYTIKDDGLTKAWEGNVWMNPPYSQPDIHNFAQKIAEEYVNGDVQSAIVLTHNYTDTAWFHILEGACSAICFTRGRIAFVNQEGEKAAPTQGQAFFYLGEDSSSFSDVFGKLGFVR